MEQRKCQECQRPMVLNLCHEYGSRWYSAYYQCPGCGVSSTAAVSESREGAARALEGLANERKLIYGRYVETGVDLMPEEEANRALKTYEDYQKLSEALLGRKAGKTAELLEAVEKIKRELAAYEGAGQRYEAEIARLKEMAAKDILLAAQSKCPCNSCTENPIDKGCTFEECEGCDHRCVCYECNDDESFVWRSGK